jgi:hypothetical protein
MAFTQPLLAVNSSSYKTEMCKLLLEAKLIIHKEEMGKLCQLPKCQRKNPALKHWIFMVVTFQPIQKLSQVNRYSTLVNPINAEDLSYFIINKIYLVC